MPANVQSPEPVAANKQSSSNHGTVDSAANIKCRVLAALQHDDGLDRLDALIRLRVQCPMETICELLELLHAPGQQTRHRAGRALLFFQLDSGMTGAIDCLIAYLRAGEDPRVRFNCGLALLPIKTPAVTHAFLVALRDPYTRVNQLACEALADRGERKTVKALTTTLEHPAWRVRLEACKALIALKAADLRVISCLDAMSVSIIASNQRKETTALNPLDTQFERAARQASLLGHYWDTVQELLAAARRQAVG